MAAFTPDGMFYISAEELAPEREALSNGLNSLFGYEKQQDYSSPWNINQYPGTCRCPYDRAKDGSLCGKRSAYSRSGGYSPKCY